MGEDFRSWRDRVITQVRFRPDRNSIARELTAHYEDHVRDLERLDYPPKLAEQRALTAMGDPEAIGKALDHVHKPWLGWLWIISKAAALVAAVVLVLTGLSVGDVYSYRIEKGIQAIRAEQPVYEADGMFFAGEAEKSEDLSRLTRTSLPASAERCGYTIRVPYAALWRSGDGTYFFSAVVTAETDAFWRKGPLLSMLRLTTDAGEMYSSGYMGNRYHPEAGRYLCTTEERAGFTQLRISCALDGVSPQWVELNYPFGEGFTFRVEFEEAFS